MKSLDFLSFERRKIFLSQGSFGKCEFARTTTQVPPLVSLEVIPNPRAIYEKPYRLRSVQLDSVWLVLPFLSVKLNSIPSFFLHLAMNRCTLIRPHQPSKKTFSLISTRKCLPRRWQTSVRRTTRNANVYSNKHGCIHRSRPNLCRTRTSTSHPPN